ncbi:MAG: hypothetical protein AMJ46_11635, partial [Latescibacteria bacterium DG_63]
MPKWKGEPIAKVSGFALMLILVLGLTGSAFAADQIDFRQSANDDKPLTLGEVHWINGIVQHSNSRYHEGMSNFQRAIAWGLHAGPTHEISFRHQFTKAGIHAYDFLTTWDQGELDDEAMLGVDVIMNECGEAIGATAETVCNSLRSGGYSYELEIPDDTYMSKDGSTLSRIQAYESYTGTNRFIRFWGNQPITGGSMSLTHDVGPGGDTGDSYAQYVITLNTTSTELMMEMAGHLARSGDPMFDPQAWGPDLGAASISGGPYHFKIDYFSDVTGSRDNQIMGGTVLPLPPICSVTPADTAFCEGGTATFTDQSTGGLMPYTYCWQKSPYTGPCITTAVPNQLVIANATLADAGDYRVIVTDANSLSDTCYASLEVWEHPQCNVTPADTALCTGGTATFTDQTTGGTMPYSYCWQKAPYSGPCITTAVPNQLVIANAALADAGDYRVIVTDYNGCADTCFASLDVWEHPQCSVTPADTAFCEGGTATFTDQTTGGTAPY